MTETRIETYIPLYRKYRPQTFADLVGQEAIAQTLGNAIQLNKVAHAYLFCGPRGTGKTSTARIFAKSLNCEQGPTMTPCLQCASCTGIAQGNALDVIEFDAASNNGVGDARELIENCQYSSMTGRFKVYIIDEVHMLTPQAFNALLKTLEEPPANVIFIFATTEAHKVLPTIISRCQRFDFNRITTNGIAARLRYIASQESIAIDEEALLVISRHARGGLRDAVGLLDQVSVLSRAQQDKVINRKDVALFIGTLEEDLLLRLGAAIAERRAADLLNDLNELLNRGLEPIQLLKDLTGHFRNLLLVQAAEGQSTPEQLGFASDYYQQLHEQSKLFPDVEEIPQIIGRLSFIERNVRNSSQAQLWMEVGLIELAYRYEINRVNDLAERVAQLEARLNTNEPLPTATPKASVAPKTVLPPPTPQQSMLTPREPAPTTAQPINQPAPQPRPITVSPPSPTPMVAHHTFELPSNASLQVDFIQICNGVASLTTRALLQQQAFPIRLENDLLTVGCASEPTLNLLKKPDKLIHLQKSVEKFFGHPVKVEIVLEKKPVQGLPLELPRKEEKIPQPELTTVTPALEKTVTSATTAVPLTIPEAPVDWMPELPEEEIAPDFPDFEEEEEDEGGTVSATQNATASSVVEGKKEELAADEEGEESITIPDSPAILFSTSSATDPDLAEAKKHAVELLQGRLLE